MADLTRPFAVQSLPGRFVEFTGIERGNHLGKPDQAGKAEIVVHVDQGGPAPIVEMMEPGKRGAELGVRSSEIALKQVIAFVLIDGKFA